MEYIDFQVNIYFTLPLVHYFPIHYYPLSFIIIPSHPLLSPLIHYYPPYSISSPLIHYYPLLLHYYPLLLQIISSHPLLSPLSSIIIPLLIIIHYSPLSYPLLHHYYPSPFHCIPPPTSIIIPYCLYS